jgi:type IV secretory pathway VirB3-like protein
MVDMSEYKKRVHRSLLQREMVAGIPQLGLLLLFLLGLIFVYGLHLYFFIVPIVLFYFVMRHMTKKDQWLIDIVFDKINQKDQLIP